jgi:hypothetical protein
MSSYAKLVLWMGLFMILAGIVKNWSLISNAIFSGAGMGSNNIYGAGGSGVKTSGGIPPLKGKCPPGYISAYGKCWSPAENPVPPTTGSGLV